MEKNSINLSKYKNTLGLRHQLVRVIWNLVWTLLARPLPRSFGNKWKVFLLRLFGAEIHSTATIYSSVRVYYPPNLIMGAYSCLAPYVECYNVDRIIIGAHTTVSQKSFLCSASHDISSVNLPLIYSPIIIEDQVWIGADVFISMGVTIAQGAVVGARSSVYKNVQKWTVVGGNPARFIKSRFIKTDI
jgi:putative colanic acid biosynthesis acetyltransferase WcaF